MTWAKNQKNEVVGIVNKLIRESPNFGQGLTVSVQSMDHDVLEISNVETWINIRLMRYLPCVIATTFLCTQN